MIIGHIGARRNSKGVAKKNFRSILGKPLIDWSLDQLFSFERVDSVVVSTDSEEIYSHAVSKGALRIGLRPAHLATDEAAKWNVWEHALEAAESLVGPASVFLDLDCTSPLRFLSDIGSSLDLYFDEKPDMVMSCCIARKNPYFNLVELDVSGALRVSKPLAQSIVARQQAPLVYEHAASIYVLSPEYLRRADELFEGRVIPYVMPPERCWDIDSELDFRIVELLLEERLKKRMAI
ncbi:MAG: acylneuraminate cytidylyltransferase family protein [Albidovulum sp.]|nr:acylneuraminate cytidylyltransferase family protein [Albidovulum sp.]MDE0306348.1 acylneuraminate cytidylyltransferase family protein [Albidovulum sp.]MDE0532159.1 acylneuraminate cytidylyltransferase family protein [Albidovulum sp.]